jgi:hypothetical protein
MRTLDKRSSYAEIGLDSFSSLLLRISYALSQRQPSEATSTMMSAAWSPVALWNISPPTLTLLFEVVDDAVSE